MRSRDGGRAFEAAEPETKGSEGEERK